VLYETITVKRLRPQPILLDIDEALVRALLHDQHRDLSTLELREVIGGWDNRMWRLGEELAVRLPLTPRAPSLLRTELRWLPSLAPELPLPVPVPIRAGEPSSRFPKTWIVARGVYGQPADRARSSNPKAADSLAEVLEALHSEAPGEAPANPDRGVPLKALGDDIDELLSVIAPCDVAAGARRIWEQGAAAPAWQDRPVWIHGDLHPANVVVTDGTLSGVIDFGEMCAGDPATDLSAAWLLLPAGTAARFFDVLRERGRCDDPASPCVGGPARPSPHRYRPEWRAGPARRQADLATGGQGGTGANPGL